LRQEEKAVKARPYRRTERLLHILEGSVLQWQHIGMSLYIFLSLGQNVLDMHKPIKEKIRRVTLGRDNNQEQSKTDVNNNDYAVSKL
jgi:hypothetical protein